MQFESEWRKKNNAIGQVVCSLRQASEAAAVLLKAACRLLAMSYEVGNSGVGLNYTYAASPDNYQLLTGHFPAPGLSPNPTCTL